MEGFNKYIPFEQIKITDRQWPSRVIDKAPVWCSVDLRDGNQALVDPMSLEEKMIMFKTLIDIGFKEIEVGFPSASETEYEILRALIDGGHIPDDVTIQVLVQAREHLIKKTFEAIKGAKNVIIHFYNSTSTLQRKVVFQKEMDGIIEIAAEGAKLIRELSQKAIEDGINIRYEYSPESFSGTEMDNAIAICERVLEELGASEENKVILNLPSTVEMCTANTYADQIEYFCRNMKHREYAIISLHPHNDRGTGVAAAELALMAGADRVEGTLFGNGERTGNVDIVTLAMNMYTQGIDPKLDFSNIRKIREIYENVTRMKVHERQPYAGDLVFTAFSGSHQDAINKGIKYMQDSKTPYWEVPYLPINPADVGRQYEPIIRINSQSGKGGAAFVMQTVFGYSLPKNMHPEFGEIVQRACDKKGKELMSEEIFELFSKEYLEHSGPLVLVKHSFNEEYDNDTSTVEINGRIIYNGEENQIKGKGNGPVDAFFNALKNIGIDGYEFISYSEHAVSSGADSKAVSYIELKAPNGKNIFGVGTSHNINLAPIRGVVCAINRAIIRDGGK